MNEHSNFFKAKKSKSNAVRRNEKSIKPETKPDRFGSKVLEVIKSSFRSIIPPDHKDQNHHCKNQESTV